MNTYLGSLCQRGHNHADTGKSLRTNSRGECVECRKLASKRYVNKHRKRHNKQSNDWLKARRKTHPIDCLCVVIKAKCKRLGLPYDLDAQYLTRLLEAQGNLCYWLNIPVELNAALRSHPSKATIDRIIPEKGYVKGNVVWASQFANIGRGDFDAGLFREFIAHIIQVIHTRSH